MDAASTLRYCWLAWLAAALMNCVMLAIILTVGLATGGTAEVEWGWYAVVAVVYSALITLSSVMHWRMLKSHWRKDRGVRPEGYLKARLCLWAGLTAATLLLTAVSTIRGDFFVYMLLALVPVAFVLWTWPTPQIIREPAESLHEEAAVEEDELFHVHKQAPGNQPV